MPRPAKQTAEEKAAEKEQKDAAKQAAAEQQLQSDLELLRLAKQLNPFKFTVNKRVPTWQAVAKEMNTLIDEDGKGFDDRRCRERVTKLMKSFRAKPPTGTGTEPKTEIQELLEFLVQEEDHTLNNQQEIKEKEEKSRILANKIQQKALQRLGSRAASELPVIRTAEELEEDFPDGDIPKRLQGRAATSSDNPPTTYKRRQMDPTTEYLAKKREQQLEETRLKKEMQEEEMKDRAAERELKKDALAFEREKLAMEEKEKDRRFN